MRFVRELRDIGNCWNNEKRSYSMLIKGTFGEVLVYDENELVDINIEKLLGLLLKDNYKQEYQEIVEILGIS